MTFRKIGLKGSPLRGAFWSANFRAGMLTLTLVIVVGIILKLSS